MLNAVISSIKMQPQRWLLALRAGLLMLGTFGLALTTTQLAATMVFVESCLLIVSEGSSTANAKLEPATVVAARAGMPAPGVNPDALREPFA